jgi:hypothetical protein
MNCYFATVWRTALWAMRMKRRELRSTDRGVMGLDVLCDGRRAFVNCTRDTLIKGLVGLLPSITTVVEILERVPADPDAMAACHSLKEQGYLIALDDYVADDRREPLADIADIIKVDLLLTTQDEREQLMKQFGPWRCRKSRNAESVRAGAGSRLRLFPGILFPPAGDDGHARHAGKPAELHTDVAGSIAPGTGRTGPGKAGQGRSIGLLPAPAISEFRCVWLQERDPFCQARLIDSWRT